MADIVIKIPDGYVKVVMANQRTEGTAMDKLLRQAVIDGTPLPKGHGDLIDRNRISKAIYAEDDNLTGSGMTYDEMDFYNAGINSMWDKLQNAEPIIEADKTYEAEVITRGNCMICGKELTEGLFLCKECGDKADKTESEG